MPDAKSINFLLRKFPPLVDIQEKDMGSHSHLFSASSSGRLDWSTTFTYAVLAFAVFMDNIRHVQSITEYTTSGIEVSNTTHSSLVDTTTFVNVTVLQTNSQTSTKSNSSMAHSVTQSATLNPESTVNESIVVARGSTPSQVNPPLPTPSPSLSVPKSTSRETDTLASSSFPNVVNSAQMTISPIVPHTTTDEPAHLMTSTLIPIVTSQASNQTVSSLVTNTDPVTIGSSTSHDAASVSDPHTAQEITSPSHSTSSGSGTTSSHHDVSVATDVITTQSTDITTTVITASREKIPMLSMLTTQEITSPSHSTSSSGSETTSSHHGVSVATDVITTQSIDKTTTVITASREKIPMLTTPATQGVTTSHAPTTIEESMQPTTGEMQTELVVTTRSTTQTKIAPSQETSITPPTTRSLKDILTTKQTPTQKTETTVPKMVKVTTMQETSQRTTPHSKAPPTQSLHSTTTDLSQRAITDKSQVSGSANVTAGPSSDSGVSAATIAIVIGSIFGFWIILGPIICIACRLRDRAKERRLRYNRKESHISNFEDMIMAELAKAQNRKCESNYSNGDIKLDLEETQKLNSHVPVSEL